MKEQWDSLAQRTKRFLIRLSLPVSWKRRLRILGWFLLPAVVLLAAFFALVLALRSFPIPMRYVEIAWAFVTGTGLAVSLWASWDVLRDVEVVEERPPTTSAARARYIVAWGSAWRGVSCAYILALFFAAGVVTLSAPAQPSSLTTTRSLLGLVVIVALLLAATSFTFMAILDRRDRQRVLHAMKGRP